jgi:hypothetical protein
MWLRKQTKTVSIYNVATTRRLNSDIKTKLKYLYIVVENAKALYEAF